MQNAPVLVLALVVAIVSVPTIAGMTAWGLTGGDGEADSAVVALLGAVVGYGAVYNVIASWLAFFDMAAWQWYLMWAHPRLQESWRCCSARPSGVAKATLPPT